MMKKHENHREKERSATQIQNSKLSDKRKTGQERRGGGGGVSGGGGGGSGRGNDEQEMKNMQVIR